VDKEVLNEVEVPMDVQGESLVILSDDAAMSVGDSDEEESESDGFSHTDSNCSHGELTRSHGSRKRPADESPEREWDETRRREFPGIVTRSEGGCRIHVPPSIRAGALEVMEQLITFPALTTDTTAVACATETTPAADTMETPDATGMANAADTTDAPGAQCASREIPGASKETDVTLSHLSERRRVKCQRWYGGRR